jgi:uncharacterized protein
MHGAFLRTSHRPWGLPTAPWRWRQSWEDLLFAHWPVKAAALRGLVPEGLRIDEYEGTSFVGVVPFRMSGVMHRPLPDLPWLSAFPEINVRLYVERDRKPGVWFLSLDARNPVAVWAARRFFHLPYFRARMSCEREGTLVRYATERLDEPRPARFRATYGPSGACYEARAGTLEHFLTERYCLYAQAPNGRLWRADVHHVPWPLQPADAEIEQNELTSSHGFELAGPPALLHFAKRLDVVVWAPTLLD